MNELNKLSLTPVYIYGLQIILYNCNMQLQINLTNKYKESTINYILCTTLIKELKYYIHYKPVMYSSQLPPTTSTSVQPQSNIPKPWRWEGRWVGYAMSYFLKEYKKVRPVSSNTKGGSGWVPKPLQETYCLCEPGPSEEHCYQIWQWPIDQPN